MDALFGIDNFSLHSYNKTTGMATLIGPTGLPNLVRAADFNPSNGSTGWKGAAGSTTTTFGRSSRRILPHAWLPGWGKSPSTISMRSPLFHSNQIDITAGRLGLSACGFILLASLRARLCGGFYPNNYLERNRCGGPVIKTRCNWMENKRAKL